MLITVPPILKLSLLDLRDQGSLAIVDLSTYASLPTAPDYALQITPPGWPTINVAFTPGVVNVYKCADLGISCPQPECCPLPDGIYIVRYTIQNIINQPDAYLEQTFIKVDQIKCKFQHAFLKVDMECNCKVDEQKALKKELRTIDMLIAGAVAQANDCNPVMAYNLYSKADAMLDRISCKFNLPCSGAWSCPQCNN